MQRYTAELPVPLKRETAGDVFVGPCFKLLSTLIGFTMWRARQFMMLGVITGVIIRVIDGDEGQLANVPVNVANSLHSIVAQKTLLKGDSSSFIRLMIACLLP